MVGLRAFVVVGPGRSGTSTITRGLMALGIALGDRLKPALRKNAKGFFEDLDLLEVNYEAHRRLGLARNGSSVAWLDDARWAAAELGDLETRAVDLIRGRFGQEALWGFKCGGVLRILPFWERVMERLGHEPSYIVAIRNPVSAARSRERLDPVRGRQEKSDLEFLAQIVPYFPRVLARPFAIADYDAVMSDPKGELHRVARTLGLARTADMERDIAAFAGEFVAGDLRHNRATEVELAQSPDVCPLTRDAYLWLLRLGREEVIPDDAGFRRDWARIETAFSDMGPALRVIDELEVQLRRKGRGFGGWARTILQHTPTRATLSGWVAGRARRPKRA